MLTIKQRTVPIRLLCLMAALLALALPTKAWDNYYLVGSEIGWNNTSDKYKFQKQSDGSWTLELPEISGTLQIMGYQKSDDCKKYGPSNGNYNLHDSHKTCLNSFTDNNPGLLTIKDGAKTSNVRITFTEKDGGPSTVSYDYYTPQTGSGSDWEIRVFRGKTLNKAYPTTQSGTSFVTDEPVDLHRDDDVFIYSISKNCLYGRYDNNAYSFNKSYTSTNPYSYATSAESADFVANKSLCWQDDDYKAFIHFSYTGENPYNIYVKEYITLAPGYPHVYLLGDNLNNNVPTQEYMMKLNTATGNYELKDFALRNARARCNDNKSQDNGFTVRYYYNSGKYEEYTDKSQSVLFDWMDSGDNGNPGYPGWACDASFTPALDEDGSLTGGTLTFSAANGQTDIKKARVLPYLGILGANFVQETKFDTPISDTGKGMGNTDLGWQEAYIQYAGGQPVILDGKAQYNTIWPPRENIRMQYKEKDSNGNFTNALPLNVSSSTLTFRPTTDASGEPVAMTATDWQKSLQAEDSYAYSGLNFQTDDLNVPDQKYVRYVCPNMWMSGQFKIWTGWGGQKADEWGAQWNNHLYFSPWSKDDNITVTAGNTYRAAGDLDHSKNYNVDGRNFFSSVEVFVPVDDNGAIQQDDQVDRAVIYLTNSLITSKIDATKNNSANKGYYMPEATLPEGWSIDSYKVVRCDYRVNPESTNKEDWQPVDAKYEETDEAGATVDSGNGSDFSTKYPSGADWTYDTELAEGTYFYYLELECSSGTQHKTVVVPSPYIDVIAQDLTTAVRLYQLVKDTNAGDDKYVTYSPASHVVYDVTLTDGVVTEMSERKDYFDYSSPKALWTSMVACATNLPSKFVTSNATAKGVESLKITYDGAEVADLTSTAASDVESRVYGNRYVGIKEFPSLTDFSGEWKAEFTATLTDANQDVQTTTATAQPASMDLTMPVYGIEKVEFLVNDGLAQDETVDVTVYDPVAGTGLNSAETALLNSLDVAVTLKSPNVEDKLISALDAVMNPDILCVGSKEYTISYTGETGAKTVTFFSEDPNDWIDENWQSIEKRFSIKGADTQRFTVDALNAYEDPSATELPEKLEATPLQLQPFKIPAVRAKVKEDENENKYWERVYMVKTNLPLADATRSQLDGVTLNTNAADEYLVIRLDGTPARSNYVNVENWMETQTLAEDKPYHRFSQIEDEGNMLLLAQSKNPSTWYDGMTDDNWVAKEELPNVTIAVANFFKGDTHVDTQGLTVQAPAGAPSAQAETASHYVLYPPMVEGELDFDMIKTAIDSVEADSLWIEAGAGFFTVKADGVSVYDVDGVKVADTQGRHDVPAGVYLALKGATAVKVYVK